MAQDPVCEPFQYLLIPSDKAAEVVVHRFAGATDEELRETLGKYFQRKGISKGQTAEFKEHLQAQVEKQTKDQPAEAGAPVPTGDFLDSMLSNSSTTFEIVPVVYPQAINSYIGTSLYIDQVGVFKELPLNERASKIAQRPIRGDAFMLRCLDDPRSDDWRRMDCSMDHYEELLRNPPSLAPDPMAQAMAQQAEQASQLAAKELTPEAVEEAQRAKDEGNEAFRRQDFAEAVARYTAAVDALAGGCPPALQAAVDPLRATCRLNRAQCHLKLEKWAAVVQDCGAVLAGDPNNAKALFRRATAYLHQGEFAASYEDLKKAESLGPSTEITKLMAQVRREESLDKKKKQQQFSKLFG
eukprot:EG_transcript_12960